MAPSWPTPALARRQLDDIQPALDAVRVSRLPNADAIVWPAGLDRSVALMLQLRARTINGLRQAGLVVGDDPLTAKQFLLVENLGVTSLKDLLLRVEAFLLDCKRQDLPLPPADSILVAASLDAPEGSQFGEHYPEQTHPTNSDPVEEVEIARSELELVLLPVLAVMAETGISERLSDALNPRALKVASVMGINDKLEGIRLDDAAAGEPGLAGRMAARMGEIVSGLSEREILILENRILTYKPTTLESLGTLTGVTRERVRQLQFRLNKRIERELGQELGPLAQLVSEDLGAIVPQEVMTERLAEVLPIEQGHTGRIIRFYLIGAMGYDTHDGMFIDTRTKAAIPEIRKLARASADDEGILDEATFLEGFLQDSPTWIEHWDWLRKQCGLYRIHGHLSIRNSAKARAKAALLTIGRPATKREIGELCGLSETQIGGAFSNIMDIVRADRTRWGLREWIDDEYDGIVGEIIQRIKEDGGTTTTSRLLSEIPSTFDVSPSSVRAYMQTPLFDVTDGIIRIADTSTLRLRHLDDVIDGRDSDGNPYWTFLVEERHFRGHSAVGVPPEFMKAIGCEPDNNIKVDVENISSDQRLSARWPLASTTGGSFGYLAQPLKSVDLRPGDRVRVTLRAPGRVALERHQNDVNTSTNNDVEDILSRMIARRRAL